MNDWVDAEFELPPEDGNYFVKNKSSTCYQGMCYYDGYGFMHAGHYVNPELWCKLPERKKRYGVIKCD